MKKLEIPVHSVVDVITNSSTVIYVQATDSTIKLAKELIDSILKVANSDKTADDLFEFSIEPGEGWLDDRIDEYMEEHEIEFEGEYGSDKYKRQHDEIAKKIIEEHDDGDTKYEDYNGWYDNRLIIKSKGEDRFTLDLTEKVKRIFEIDGERDG